MQKKKAKKRKRAPIAVSTNVIGAGGVLGRVSPSGIGATYNHREVYSTGPSSVVVIVPTAPPTHGGRAK